MACHDVAGGEKETGGGRESGSDSWKQYMRRSTWCVRACVCLCLFMFVRVCECLRCRSLLLFVVVVVVVVIVIVVSLARLTGQYDQLLSFVASGARH